MEIIKIRLENLTPYPNNAKQHPKEQVEQIKASIEKFGNNDPIAVWGENNIIVEGHGRFLALKDLGVEEVECIRLDHLTEEERKAYTLAHNQLTMNTGWNMDMLNLELSELEALDFDMSEFGFLEGDDIDWADVEDLSEETYDKPEKDKLQCPCCGHIAEKALFAKVKEGADE